MRVLSFVPILRSCQYMGGDMEMTLYPHQKKFIDTAPDKYLCAHGTGLGKTKTSIAIAEARAKSALIICPKGIASKWKAEHIAIPHEVLTKEQFKKIHKTLQKYDAVIWDEFHHASGMKSQLHKAALWYIKNRAPRFVWGLSATPCRRDAWNVYALARLLGHNWNYQSFRQEFFYEQHFGPYKVVWLPKKDKTTQERLAALVRKIGDVVSYEEVKGLQDVAHFTEIIEMNADQKRAIKDLQYIEANPLTAVLREHQIANGIGAKPNKDERLLGLAEESKKLCIFARYRAEIDRYKLLFPEAHIIDGRVRDKDAVAKKVELEDGAIVIIQIQSAEGIELGSVHTIVFTSKSYSFLDYKQALGRFSRINVLPKPKRFFHLLSKGSVDEAIEKNIQAKSDFNDKVYAKNKTY